MGVYPVFLDFINFAKSLHGTAVKFPREVELVMERTALLGAKRFE